MGDFELNYQVNNMPIGDLVPMIWLLQEQEKHILTWVNSHN